MLQITPQMRILVCIEAVDFRNGIDGLAQRCKAALGEDPFRGTVFVFRNRRSTAVKVLGVRLPNTPVIRWMLAISCLVSSVSASNDRAFWLAWSI